MQPARIRWTIAILAFGAAFAFGCSDSTGPASDDGIADDDVLLSGTIDPAQETFLIRSEDPDRPGERHGRFDLVGSGPIVDPEAGTVSFDVRIRNASRDSVAAPLVAWIGRLRPGSVTLVNADVVDSLESGRDPLRFGFDYSGFLGVDSLLAPAELSEARVWTFHDPDLVPFTFAARVQAGEVPVPPVAQAWIAGRLFLDDNRDGTADSTEPGFPGMIVMTAPDGQTTRMHADRSGWYRFAIRAAGMYELRCERPASLRGEFTTPNPLQVVVVADEEGRLQSVRGVHFGFALDDEPQGARPAIMTDRPLEALVLDPCILSDANLRGDILAARLGYSGCNPRHPVQLFISNRFAESNPVQTRALIVHDDLDEPCDAAFEETFLFDLAPLREAYLRAYGRPGVILIRVSDSFGGEREILYRIAGCDSIPGIG